jgi:hypothetical protein
MMRKLPTAKNVDYLPNSETFKIALGDNWFQLPGGIVLGGKWLRKVRLRELNGYDEEAIGAVEARNTAWRTIDIVLQRAIEAIEDITDKSQITELVPRMYSGDRTALLFMLEKISSGDVRPVEIECSRCGVRRETDFDLDNLKYDAYDEAPPGEIIGELPVGYSSAEGVHKKVVLRLPTGETERRIAESMSNVGAVRTKLISSCLVQLGELPALADVIVQGMVVKDRKYLSDLVEKYSPGVDLSARLSCSSCGSENTVGVYPTAFFGF